jgi:hypothetical protein
MIFANRTEASWYLEDFNLALPRGNCDHMIAWNIQCIICINATASPIDVQRLITS